MASPHINENVVQCNTCRYGEGDTNIWTARTSDNPDKQLNKCPNCQVFKSGPLFISSKGIGWTSWKRRWFILTRTSLVFFRSDPNALPQKGSEANLTLGGIELNNSGSVAVRADKKLLTVLFPDGRDGRAFTLKAETSEDLYEWKAALENALAQAPSAALVTGQNGIFRNDIADSIEASFEQWRDRRPVKSLVVGRPILLALEDIDGSPSFLEKALRFIEQYGVKVEGILRQSADVEEVERRVQEYEQGKNEFSSDEDAHVVGDCIKHVLRELPSSPVPASCCTALLEAFRYFLNPKYRYSATCRTISKEVRTGMKEVIKRVLRDVSEQVHAINQMEHYNAGLGSFGDVTARNAILTTPPETDRGARVNAMRAAISETFPEPNRRLMQRILKMMRTVASHKYVNRMTLSAVAACMAPLLLRPLLAGDCELEDDFNMSGDGSIQLLQAAAAANHAQAIVITLLEEYEKIFVGDLLQEGSLSSELYSESENGDAEDEDSTDDDIMEDDGYHDAQNDLEVDTEDDLEHASCGTPSESSGDVGNDLYDNKLIEDHDTDPMFPEANEIIEVDKKAFNMTYTPLLQQDIDQKQSPPTHIPLPQHASAQKNDTVGSQNNNSSAATHESHESMGGVLTSATSILKSVSHNPPSSISDFTDISNEPVPSIKRPTVWGRTAARKNLSMESIDYSSEDEIAIQRLESTKSDLQTKITKEVKGNAILQGSLEKRKEVLHERRLTLEEDVERLREQLQKERDLRVALESGLMNMRPGHFSITSTMDYKSVVVLKTRADLEEIALAEADIINLKQKVADLRGQLSHQLQHSYASLCESCSQHLCVRHQSTEKGQQKDIGTTTLIHQKENSSKSEDTMSGAACDCVPATQDLPSSPNRQPYQIQQPEFSSQNNIKSSGDSSPSSTKSSIGGTNAPPKKFSPKGENSLFGADHENAKMQTLDSTTLPTEQPPQRQQPNTTNRNCTNSLKSRTKSSTDDPITVGQNAASKKSISRGENSLFGGNHENVKAQDQDSPYCSLTKQPPQKQHPNGANLNSTKSLVSNSVSSTEMPITVGRSATSKKSSSRGEETVSSSSSALTRLTNRLNFLKERRVQLVNELQNMDTSRTSGPVGPPPRTNSR